MAPVSLPVFTAAPIQTTTTLYERGFEKIMKKQNKEQVPPPAVEPKKPGNKKQTKKVATLANQNQKQGRFRSLEEALKAVSVPRWGEEEDLRYREAERSGRGTGS